MSNEYDVFGSRYKSAVNCWNVSKYDSHREGTTIHSLLFVTEQIPTRNNKTLMHFFPPIFS